MSRAVAGVRLTLLLLSLASLSLVWGCAADEAGGGVACEGAGCEQTPDAGEPDADEPDADLPDVSPDEPDVEPEEDADDDFDPFDVGPRDEPDAQPDVAEEPEDEVDVTAPLASQGMWGPAARVVAMSMPENPREARAEGCFVLGNNVGTGLSSLLQLAGGLDQFLLPDANGQIALLLMARLLGWEEGLPPTALESLDVEVYTGVVGGDGEYLIRPESFEEGDPDGAARVAFPGSLVDDAWLETSYGVFPVTLPVLGTLVVNLTLQASRITGRLYAEGPGAGLARGVLVGYIDRQGVAGLIEDVQAACASEDAPSVCGPINALIPLDRPAEESIDQVVLLIGGFDARISGGQPYECDRNAEEGDRVCNAVGLCMLIEMEPIEIAGVAAP